MSKRIKADTRVATLIHVPSWIEQDITVGTLDAIVREGCVSRIYMAAVSPCTALETMSRHGDAVLYYIRRMIGSLPLLRRKDAGWSDLACHYLSTAVGIWASAEGAGFVAKAAKKSRKRSKV